ncbi:COX7 Cytochrome c oxidase subunit 7 [Candida maltosa Xu316]
MIDAKLDSHEILKVRRSECENNYNLDVRSKSLFGELFNLGSTVIDTSDGVPRCATCHWEAHGPVCERCGMRFRRAPNSSYDFEDVDDDEENFEDVQGGFHHNDAYDSDDSFIDSRTANEIPVVDSSDEDEREYEEEVELSDAHASELLSSEDEIREINNPHAEEWHGFESATSSVIDRAFSRTSADDDDDSHTEEIGHYNDNDSENVIQLSGDDDDASYYDSEDIREALEQLDNNSPIELSDDSMSGYEMDDQSIIELQKHYQNTPKPLWLRGKQSAFLVYPFYALFTIATVVPLYYSGRAVCGLKERS